MERLIVTRELGVKSLSFGLMKSVWILLFVGTMFLASCGGGSSSSSQSSGPLVGNWQFNLQNPPDGSFMGVPNPNCSLTPPYLLCPGGLLQQNKGSVTGGIVYATMAPGKNGLTVCASGSAPVTGTLDGQNVTITVPAGAQTFTLTGTLSADGSTMMGTYTSTDGNGCGTAQTGLNWTATAVPPLTGAVQGNLHSKGTGLLNGQDFPVTGTLTQGPNIGASNATVTGTLSFAGYPCLDSASVNGQISGGSVVLQVIANNGSNVGLIGAPPGSQIASPVTVQSVAGGTVLASTRNTSGYGISTKACPAGGIPGDQGDICLALGNTTVCTQPIMLSPGSLVFPPQLLGSTPTTQTVTLTNTDPSGSTLSGINLSLPQGNGSFAGPSDFDLLPNFTEQDTCASSLGTPFSLTSGQSCSITISFSPQQSCQWLPFGSLPFGSPPSLCPVPLTASLQVNSPKSEDDDKVFTVPFSGTGLSALVPSTPELDFGSEAVSETSAAQTLSFTNQGTQPVQILPSLSNPPCGPDPGVIPVALTRPLVPGAAPGLQTVQGTITADQSNNTVDYICDIDTVSMKPNFQITQDTCSGALITPQNSCSLQVAFAPQSGTSLISGLDYFLELNTLQCTSNTTADCEIDAGRFPVEIKANTPSPLRMTPGAGLDFGIVTKGQVSPPQQITLYNDPKDPHSQTINFTGNPIKGDYTETDNCGATLAPGNSCTLTITFTPKVVGPDPGTMTITYTVQQTQFVFLRGTGQ